MNGGLIRKKFFMRNMNIFIRIDKKAGALKREGVYMQKGSALHSNQSRVIFTETAAEKGNHNTRDEI